MMKYVYLSLLIIFSSCAKQSETEIYQSSRDNTLQVRDKVKEIVINDVLIGQISPLCILDDYLIIGDVKSQDAMLHIFDKNDFRYLNSVLKRGEGPNEITNMGYIGIDKEERKFNISDHGKQKILSYDIDSILCDSLYIPNVKAVMNKKMFPNKYKLLKDSLYLALIIEPTGNSGYKEAITKWNIKTGEMKNMPYEHTEIEKKRVDFDLSTEHGQYVECYLYQDLMTICDQNGNLKYNIYGPNWDNGRKDKFSFYCGVNYCKDKIIALYSGKETFYRSSVGGTKVYRPTQFLIFDLNGKYISTLETEYQILNFCYDEDNNRIIMSLDDDIQFAYLSMDGII